MLVSEQFQIDSSLKRIKRGTTIVHHRIRKKRPLRKRRRPTKHHILRPIYGPPSAHMYNHQSNSLLLSQNRPYIQRENINNFAEPPVFPTYTIPSVQSSSIPLIKSGNNIFQQDITQYQSQQVPSVQPPPLTSHSEVINQQDEKLIQTPPKTNVQSTYLQSLPTSGTIESLLLSQSSNTASSLSPSKSNLKPVSNANLQYISNNRLPISSKHEISLQNVPMDSKYQQYLYQNTASSYDVPLTSIKVQDSNLKKNYISATETYLAEKKPSQILFNNKQIDNLSQHEVKNSHALTIPSSDESLDFTSIKTKIPENQYNRVKDIHFFDDDFLENYLKNISESKRVSVMSRSEKKKSKSNKKQNSRIKPDSVSAVYTNGADQFTFTNTSKNNLVTKTKRKKRPRISTTTPNNIDDVLSLGSETHEYIIDSEYDLQLDQNRYHKHPNTLLKSKSINLIPISKTVTLKPSKTNHIYVSDHNDLYQKLENHLIRINKKSPTHIQLVPTFAYSPSKPKSLDSSEEANILRNNKLKTLRTYMQSEKENIDDTNIASSSEESFPHDLNTFTSGVYLKNGEFGTRLKHARTNKNMNSEEEYFFEAEYEIELPSINTYYKN